MLDFGHCRVGWSVRGTVEAMSREHSDLLSLKRLLFEVAPQALQAETERKYLHFRSGHLPEPQASPPPTQVPSSFPQTGNARPPASSFQEELPTLAMLSEKFRERTRSMWFAK